MTMRTLLGIGLCLMFIGTTSAIGQELVTIQFIGEIETLSNRNIVSEAGMSIGDPISGSLTYDPYEAQPRVFSNEYVDTKIYDLKTNAATQFVVRAAGRTFISQETQLQEPNANFTCKLQQGKSSPANNAPACNVYFSHSNPSARVNNSAYSYQLSFKRVNCNRGDYDNVLPYVSQTMLWDEMILNIYYRVDGEDKSFTARVTSLTSNAEPFGRVNGSIFADANGNCQNDDPSMLRNFLVEFTPGPFYTLTQANGDYKALLPLGTYEAKIVERPLWELSCVNDDVIDVVLESEDQTVAAEHAVKPTRYVEALAVSLAAGRARPGFELEYCIRLENVGTLPYSGTVLFEHDPLLTEFSSMPRADEYVNPFAEWRVEDLPVGSVTIIKISMTVPADESLLGTFVCARVKVDKDRNTGDEILSETDELCTEIRGAYDPNDIQVFSSSRNADGPITADDKVLSYLIRFQNEGNEPAITVKVVDALSEFHNIKSVRFGASSHEAEISIGDDGELVWTFNDINLVPKSVDEVASQGYVKFEITLQDDLAVGTQIPNSAAIFFDFNSPVITNTVVSQIVNTTTSVTPELYASAVNIFPNPTADRLMLRFEQPGETTLTLRNVLGQTMLSETVNSAVHSLDLRALAAGSYFLTVETAAGSLVKTVNVSR